MTLGCEQKQQTAAAVISYCRRLNSVLNLNGSSSRLDHQLLELVHEFRDSQPEKFKEIARVQLSFLIDLPHFDEDDIGADKKAGAASSRLKRRGRRGQLGVLHLLSGGKSRASQASTAGWHSVAERVTRLIGHLMECDRYKAEGLFRKTGNCGRQKELKRQLLTNSACSLTDYTVHDVANVIKLLLRSLEEPLISERLTEILTGIADLCSKSDRSASGHRTESEEKIVKCRQLKAVRIFALLVPQRTMAFVTRLLHFLKTVSCCQETRMTSDSLGTVFGPVLFCPKSLEASAYQKRVTSINRLTTFLIDNCHRINEIPRSFAEDVSRNWQKFSSEILQSNSPASATPSSCRSSANRDDSVDTGVRFSERRQAGGEDYGERQLAELYAHIRQLPESKEKRRLEKRFNHHLLCCTPDRQFSFRKRLHRTAGACSLTRLTNKNFASVDSGLGTCAQETPVGRFFCRDRRLLRALSSIRVYKCCNRQQEPQQCLNARLSFDCWSDERRDFLDEAPRKKRRLSSVGCSSSSSSRLVFADSADVARRVAKSKRLGGRTAQSPQLLRATRFLETAL